MDFDGKIQRRIEGKNMREIWKLWPPLILYTNIISFPNSLSLSLFSLMRFLLFPLRFFGSDQSQSQVRIHLYSGFLFFIRFKSGFVDLKQLYPFYSFQFYSFNRSSYSFEDLILVFWLNFSDFLIFNIQYDDINILVCILLKILCLLLCCMRSIYESDSVTKDCLL